jgi:O-acetyl-ADP-ribose deacetylase (regulator of RNase III)
VSKGGQNTLKKGDRFILLFSGSIFVAFLIEMNFILSWKRFFFAIETIRPFFSHLILTQSGQFLWYNLGWFFLCGGIGMKIHYEYKTPEERYIRLVQGDITEQKTDAIVNAANSHLQHGGGVAGAIVRKGGHIIQEESNKIGYVPVGKAAVTTAGNLKAKFVIHVVGPRWGEGDEDNKLKNAVLSSLKLASEKNLKTISIPAISSGIFGFPKDRCAEILIRESAGYLKENPKTSLKEINICLFDDETVKIFLKEFEKQFVK